MTLAFESWLAYNTILLSESNASVLQHGLIRNDCL